MYPSIRVTSGSRIPLGYQQISAATLASATLLTVPNNSSGMPAAYAVIQCESSTATDSVRWRDDGTDPTASVGMTLGAGMELDYSGDVTKITFIVGAGSPKLNISYYS